jgi:hypothetical protein
MAQLAHNPETGEWLELQGEEWVPLRGPSPADRAWAEEMASPDWTGASALTSAQMIGGDYWGPSVMGATPEQYQALREREQAAHPYATAGTAIAGAAPGLMMGPAAGVAYEAALGGMLSPDDPAFGAATGAALAGAGYGALPAYRAVRSGNMPAMPGFGGHQAARGAEVPRGAPGAPPAAGDVMGPPAPASMAERVAARMGGEAAPPQEGRVLQGMVTPEEAAQQGMPLTRGDVLALQARNSDEMAAAKRVRDMEELRRSDRVAGRTVEDIRARQQEWATNKVKAELGIEGTANLTDDVLSAKLNQLGAQFDEFAEQVGTVRLTDDTFAQLDEVVEAAGSNPYAGQLKKIAENAKEAAARNGGSLSGRDWQSLRRRISRMMESGKGQADTAKLYDAGRMMDVMTEAIEESLPAAVREAIRQTRYEYAIANKVISRAGIRNAEQQINPNALYNAMRETSRIRGLKEDSLLRQLETARFLTNKVRPDSGTAARLLANPTKAAAGAIGGGVLYEGVGALTQ